MTEINFNNDDSGNGSTIVIPEEGDLQLSFAYGSEEVKKLFRQSRPSVGKVKISETEDKFDSVQVKLKRRKGQGLDKVVIMLWEDQRREWVAVIRDGELQDPMNANASYSGPFSLNDYCKDKLLEAYGQLGKISPDFVHKKTPSELFRA